MELIPWWAFAIYVSVIAAVFNQVNARAKIDGIVLQIPSAFFCCLIVSPAFLFIDAPTHWMFYFSAFITAILLSFSQVKKFNVSASHGAVLSSISRSLHIVLSFIIWNLIFWDDLFELVNNQQALLGVFIAIALIALSQILLIRKGESHFKSGFYVIFAIAFINSFSSIFVKTGMGYTDFLWQALIWTAVLNFFIFLFTLARFPFQKKSTLSDIFDIHVLKNSFGLSVVKSMMAPVATLAIATAPNPAFASALFMLSTVWLAGYYKISGRPTNIQPLAAVLLIASALILIFSTANLSS